MGYAWGSNDPHQKPPKPKPLKPNLPNYNEDYYNTSGDSAWNKTHPSTSTGGGSVSSAPTHDYYAEAMASAERRRREEERRLREANRAAVDAGITTLQGQIPLINQGAYGQTTDAYVRNEQAKAAMPQQMAAMGNTGGMSESSMIGVNANYQNMINGITQEKQNALNGIQGDIARLQSEGDMNLANQLAQSSDKYYEQMIRNQMAQAAAQEKERLALIDVATKNTPNQIKYNEEMRDVLMGVSTRADLANNYIALIELYGEDGFNKLYKAAKEGAV